MAANASGKRRIGSYLVIALACVLLFLIPSSYIVGRGWPLWLAAVVGALAFPLVPGAWHLIAERRRRKRVAAVAAASKPPGKPSASASASSLSGRDRLSLRMIAVALVAIAPLVVLDRGGVWSGLRHHTLWFIPADTDFDGGFADTFVRQVPADAETVVVMRDHPRKLIDRSYRQRGGMVSAQRGRDSMMVLPKNASTEDTALLRSLIGFEVSTLTPVMRDDVVIATTGEWGKVGSGPSDAMLAQLARVPDAAAVAIGVVPREAKDREWITAGAAWVTQTSSGLSAGGRFELTDPTRGEDLITLVKTGMDLYRRSPKCPAEIGKVVDAVKLEVSGPVVVARLELSDAVVRELAACFLGVK